MYKVLYYSFTLLNPISKGFFYIKSHFGMVQLFSKVFQSKCTSVPVKFCRGVLCFDSILLFRRIIGLNTSCLLISTIPWPTYKT